MMGVIVTVTHLTLRESYVNSQLHLPYLRVLQLEILVLITPYHEFPAVPETQSFALHLLKRRISSCIDLPVRCQSIPLLPAGGDTLFFSCTVSNPKSSTVPTQTKKTWKSVPNDLDTEVLD